MKKFLTTLILAIAVWCLPTNSNAQIDRNYVHYIGQELISEGKYNEAIDMLNILIRIHNTSADAYFLRGVAKYNLGDLIGAESDFTNATQINSVFTVAYQYRAITRSLLGNYDDSLADYATAIDIRPDSEGLFYSRGVTHFLSQQFENAVGDFSEFIRRKPNNADGYVNRGSCYLMLGDTINAMDDYNKAVNANIYDPLAYLRRGSLYLQQNMYEQAHSDLSTTIKLDSLNLAAHFNRAIVNAKEFRLMEAISDFDSVIKIDSTNSITYFNRAILRSQIGDYNRALEDYDKVEKLSPHNVLLYYNRGGLNNQLGRIEEAEKDLTTAIDLYPDFANAYLQRSSVRRTMGRMSESKSDYNTAQQKIKEYREKMDDKAFSIYADTSKVFNALLSFDNNINNTDFKTGTSAIDGYQSSSMSRFVASSSADLFNRNKSYKNSSITKEEAKLNDFEIRLTTLVEQLSIEEIDRIEATVDSLITIEIDNPTLYFAKGALEHSRRQYTNAIQNYTYAIELDPENAFYYMNRAVAYTEMTDFVMQLDNQNQQLLINSDQTNQLKNIRRKYNYDDAFRDINIAIRKNPEVAHFHYNKGAILARANESVRAIESYTTAIELHPEMMEAFFNRGLILIELSDTKKGLLDISQAGELGNMEAYEILQSYSDKLNR